MIEVENNVEIWYTMSHIKAGNTICYGAEDEQDEKHKNA